MIGARSRASLIQYLEYQQQERLEIIFNKYGIETPEFIAGWERPAPSHIGRIKRWLEPATPEAIDHLLTEIVATERTLYYNRTSNAQVYNERYHDLTACLALDGYVIRNGALLRAEPNLDTAPLEDDLTRELQQSGLPDAANIVQLLDRSAEDFRGAQPDLNGSLTNARVALQTLGTNISAQEAASRSPGFDETKWGQVVAHLRTAGLITPEEEKGIAGAFGFVSPGAHNVMGFSDTEMVRFGRNLVVTMCYFLVKRWNGRQP